MLLSLILDDIEAMNHRRRDAVMHSYRRPQRELDDEMHSYIITQAMLDEFDEMFKGIAMNGQGIGIDFDEIRKAEEMYKDV
jgi:hypothetical protein